MTPLAYRSRVSVAIAMLGVSLFVLWMLVPETLSVFTYVLSATGIIALAAVTLNTYRNSQPTRSMAQLLHETEVERRDD